MAIYKRSNVVEMVRAAKCPYWKIFESDQKKTAGNYVCSADWDVADLGINAACEDLVSKLNALSQGRYVLTAYEKNDGKRKGLDSWIELEPLMGASPIAGIGSTGQIDNKVYIEGIGNVSPDNIGEAIEKKFAIMQEKLRGEAELAALKLEVKTLRAEASQNDAGFNKSLISIGSLLYPIMSKTPAFKEVVGIVGDITKAARSEGASMGVGSTADETPTPENHVEGDMMEIGGTQVNQDRMLAALDKLGANNPDVLLHIETLANTKVNDPDTYQAGLDFLKN